MKRDAINQLYEWKDSATRKPLIVRGARQVGKTWLIKHFAEQAYTKYVYVNFEDNDLVKDVFSGDYNIERIVSSLQLIYKQKIDKDTLIIFDEIQEAPRALTALKYFCEKAPGYHVIAAGSLLGIAMHANTSFPVGKVDFIDLYPLSFQEFLDATGNEMLLDTINSRNWEMIDMLKDELQHLLRTYTYVGGMPEAINTYLATNDFEQVRAVHNSLLKAYDNDFSKHATPNEVPRIRMVWKSIAAQLVKENKKFIFGLIKEGARAKDFELAIEWLKDAGLIYKVNRTKKGEFPLSAYEDFAAFKLFIFDSGLLGAMHNIPAQIIIEGNRMFDEYKGALTEQYVLQQLISSFHNLSIYYWSAENSRGELDFIVQKGDKIYPIEVKASENLRAKSLRSFIEKYPSLKGIRFSMSGFRDQEWMQNIPLCAVHTTF